MGVYPSLLEYNFFLFRSIMLYDLYADCYATIP